MNDQPNAENQLDDRLAELTDRLLNNEEVEVESTWTDSDLAELENTIRRLKSVAQAARPDAAAEGRIRSRLASEWKQSMRPRWNWTWPRWVTAGASAAFILAGIVGLLGTKHTEGLSGSSGLAGAAENLSAFAPAALLVGIILFVGLLLSNRK
ncbi:MAG: hypothetical protein JW987_10860 [Anaerolineaceae bacterium]|nr:hypothetical protein [Anaerolineaceae bacterium]